MSTSFWKQRFLFTTVVLWWIDSPFVLCAQSTTPSVSSDCAALGSCLPSLTQYVNAAVGSGTGGVSFAMDSGGNAGNASTLANMTQTTTMSFTINQCADLLNTQLESFQSFQDSNNQVWSDVETTQQALVNVESTATTILGTETNFTTHISQVASLFQNTTARSNALSNWVTGEKVVRDQLNDLYNLLDTTVMTTSDNILVTTSAIRDALITMQKVNDHATKILTAVGDAETQMYQWAFNVSQKVNEHTVSLVTIAQTLQYRTNQVATVTEDNVKLNWILNQLANTYGTDKLTQLAQAYDQGTLEMPTGVNITIPSINSTATSASTNSAGTISQVTAST